ncbi:MAG: right-handed parallel beta-helix repeat-containing protein [Thermomicrobiales bacterium]
MQIMIFVIILIAVVSVGVLFFRQRSFAKPVPAPIPAYRDAAPSLTRARTRELVVDPSGKGAHRSITSAIDAALPGDRVLVRPGNYLESVDISKPIEVLGNGPRERIIIRCEDDGVEGSVLILRSSGVRVSGLTLIQEGSLDVCVDLSAGQPVIENCDITSVAHRPGVAVCGDGDPIIRKNAIHGCRGYGVAFLQGAKGTLEGNDIYGNGAPGVCIRDNSDPRVVGNRIHGNGPGIPEYSQGIYVGSEGRGTLEDNEIFDHAGAGVIVDSETGDRPGGTPRLFRNRIHHNGLTAIEVIAGGGVFEGNDLRGNRLGAWEIAPDCESRIARFSNKE